MYKRLQQVPPAHLWLLLGLCLVFAPHINYQPWLVGLCWILVLAWRLLFDLGVVKLPGRFVLLALALATTALVGVLHHTIIGRDAGAALLITMLALKLLEMKTWRDISVTIFLAYFVVITGFLFSQSMIIGAYMVAVIFVLTTALVSFNQIQKGRKTSRRTLRLTTTMLLQAIPLAVFMFLLFPRLAGPLWSLPEDAFSGKTGLSDSMSPGNISRLTDNDAVAFRVRFTGNIPNPSRLYWRGPVFTVFDGRTWRRSAVSREKIFLSGDGPIPNEQLLPDPGSELIDYTVTLEPHNRQWLFALDIPTRINRTSFLSVDYELKTQQRIKTAIQYTVQSTIRYKLDAATWPIDKRYLRLPRNIAPKARRLVTSIQDKVSDSSPYDQQVIRALLHYFVDNPFIYSKQPPRLLGDPVDEFLFDTRKGFCEHFASTFAVLARMAGIPARVVTGYQGGEMNTLGDYMIVRQSSAHAWTEVWVKGEGWVRTDPTATIPSNRVEQPQFQDRFSPDSLRQAKQTPWLNKLWKNFGFAVDNLNHQWDRWVIGYNSVTQTRFLNWLGFNDISWDWMTAILVAALVGILLPLGYFLLSQTPQQRDPVIKIYRRFCRRFKRDGINKRPGETASAFAARINRRHPALTPQINRITKIYNDLRYAKSTNEASLHVFKKQVASLKL